MINSVALIGGRFASRGSDRAESTEVLTANDCPRCAARDAVRLETDENFCPWCLHAWPAAGSLILDRESGREQEYLTDLARAFEQD